MAVADDLTGGPAAERLIGLGSEVATPEQMTSKGFADFIRADIDAIAAAKLADLKPQ